MIENHRHGTGRAERTRARARVPDEATNNRQDTENQIVTHEFPILVLDSSVEPLASWFYYHDLEPARMQAASGERNERNEQNEQNVPNFSPRYQDYPGFRRRRTRRETPALPCPGSPEDMKAGHEIEQKEGKPQTYSRVVRYLG